MEMSHEISLSLSIKFLSKDPCENIPVYVTDLSMLAKLLFHDEMSAETQAILARFSLVTSPQFSEHSIHSAEYQVSD